jgi:hypothetical protein
MVTRDVNHPSIIFWNNGNEGGSNPELDKVFYQFDPQQRRVLHPWGQHNGINTAHYLAYTNAEVAARGEPMHWHMKENAEFVNTNLAPSGWIYMPTEFMHGLYDGGAGAGLEDYWNMMMSYSNCAGGFIWVLTDDAIRRPDTGELDTAGNQAPDGIVGPYREREGSFYAIKDIWSPIQVKRKTNGTFTVENHYSFTDASECRVEWVLGVLKQLGDNANNSNSLERGSFSLPKAGPGGQATLPAKFGSWSADVGLLTISVIDPNGRELWRHAWQAKGELGIQSSAMAWARAVETNNLIVLRYGELTVRIRKSDGLLDGVLFSGKEISLANGPKPTMGRAVLTAIEHSASGADYVVMCRYEGGLQSIAWRIVGGVSGEHQLRCDYTYSVSGERDFWGVVFDYPENLVKRKRWLGDGPFRVWKNRLRGVTFGLWENDYNNTITGHSGWVYPEFKGCFSNVRWLQLETTEGLITVVPENIPYVQVLTPEQPPDNLVGKTKVNLPQCGLGFLHAIPPIGTKFKDAASSGPQSQPNVGQGEYSGRVSFYFGKLP